MGGITLYKDKIINFIIVHGHDNHYCIKIPEDHILNFTCTLFNVTPHQDYQLQLEVFKNNSNLGKINVTVNTSDQFMVSDSISETCPSYSYAITDINLNSLNKNIGAKEFFQIQLSLLDTHSNVLDKVTSYFYT